MTEQTTASLAEATIKTSSQDLIAQLFTEARTHKTFLDQPVEEATLRQL